MRRALPLALLAGLALAACSSSDSDSGDGASALSGPAGQGTACDPLAAGTSAVKLSVGSVNAAGKASDGTVYALVGFSSLRLFASRGAKLVEVVVLGSGEGQDGGKKFWTASFTDASGQMAAVMVQDDGTGKTMGLARGDMLGKGFEVGSVGEVLAPVDEATILAMPAEKTDTFHLELVASLSDGREVVVTAPDHADSYAGFRAFLGPPSSMAEQTVLYVLRTLDINSTTDVQMKIDGAEATLTWKGTQASLSLPSGTAQLTVASPPSLPAGAAFVCK